ncbi:MAG: hypothetical protein LBB83_04285 [Treponema sp.]|jgi:hypothetical protein|nr:hypothetical protein [Treponema sp.]
MAMSNAERQRKYREARKSEGKRYKWVKRTKKRIEAGDIARQKFDALVSEKLKDAIDDTTIWEFYTFLYKKAKEHKPDYSGFASVDYQADRETAKTITENYT